MGEPGSAPDAGFFAARIPPRRSKRCMGRRRRARREDRWSASGDAQKADRERKARREAAASGGLGIDADGRALICGQVLGQLLEHGRDLEKLDPDFRRARRGRQARQPDGLFAVELRRSFICQHITRPTPRAQLVGIRYRSGMRPDCG
jgi:hypothetical protein